MAIAHLMATSFLSSTRSFQVRAFQMGRWLYVTNPSYLILEPPLMSFLSLYTITPQVKFERVAFLNNDCMLEGNLMNETVLNATLIEMHDQLFKSLHPERGRQLRARRPPRVAARLSDRVRRVGG